MSAIDFMLEQGSPPVIAILRGVMPNEAVAIGSSLVDAGIHMIEVPLNSVDPFRSIAAMQEQLSEHALIGAGTVLDEASVALLAKTGARLMVTPNTNIRVIESGIDAGLEVMPGFFSPGEAILAVAAGAHKLKLFPADSLGPSHLKAVAAVLPRDVKIWAVGGVNQGNAAHWLAAGAQGVALGGALYRPGMSPREVRDRAEQIIAALRS